MITQVVVGDTPPVAQGFADYLDGHRAILHRADIGIVEGQTGPELIIAQPGRDWLHWRLADIRRVPDQASRDELVLAHSADPAARLIVQDPEIRRLLVARCGNLHRRPVARGRGRLVLWAMGAVASVALIILVLVPVMANQLAEYLSPEGERALGDSTFGQIRRALDDTGLTPLAICKDPAGAAALDLMTSRLVQQVTLPYPVDVYVLDHGLVNAFALPGGLVILFRGLIDAAQTPDEVAAVLAHELGHVAARDPTRIALRSAGSIGVLGLLLGDFAGGTVVLFLAERVIQATYTKEAEAEADAFAHRVLIGAAIPPSALASIFGRLRDKYGDKDGLAAHFASHPSLGDRIALASAADRNLTGARHPSLSDSDWLALRHICR